MPMYYDEPSCATGCSRCLLQHPSAIQRSIRFPRICCISGPTHLLYFRPHTSAVFQAPRICCISGPTHLLYFRPWAQSWIERPLCPVKTPLVSNCLARQGKTIRNINTLCVSIKATSADGRLNNYDNGQMSLSSYRIDCFIILIVVSSLPTREFSQRNCAAVLSQAYPIYRSKTMQISAIKASR